MLKFFAGLLFTLSAAFAQITPFPPKPSSGGFGTSACSTKSVVANAVTLAYTAPLNCNKFTITAATTVTLPTPSGNAVGPVLFEITNSGPVTGTNIIYAGATQIGLPTTVDASSNNAVTTVQMHYDGSQWVFDNAASATAGALSSGQIYAASTTGPPIAATSTNVIAVFSGCSGTQYLGADGACHNSAAAANTFTANGGSWDPFGTLYCSTCGTFAPQAANTLYVAEIEGGAPAGTAAKIQFYTGAGANGYHVAWALYSSDCGTKIATSTASVGTAGGMVTQAFTPTFVAGTSYRLAWSYDTLTGSGILVVDGSTTNLTQFRNTGVTTAKLATGANTVSWAAGVPTFPSTCGALSAASLGIPMVEISAN